MKSTKEVLPFVVILQAVNGDVNAINQILKHFEHYIIRLSQKHYLMNMAMPIFM